MEWIDIKDYEGLYQINILSDVRRLTAIVRNRGNINMLKRGQISKPFMEDKKPES